MKDLAGMTFGRWTVIEPAEAAEDAARSRRWFCRCACGVEKIVYEQYLLNGRSISCGCSRAIDLAGKRFGALTVIRMVPKEKRGEGYKQKLMYWECKCDCGAELNISAQSILRENRRSCGCQIHKRHPKRDGGRPYKIFQGMKSRCYNKNATGYKNYGGRGISICDEWLNDFWAFHAWALSSGYDEGLTIDRIDNDKGYCPENCRWATKAEQNRNKRTVKREVISNV